MSDEVAPSERLQRLADALGLQVASFLDPAEPPAVDRLVRLMTDPHGLRIAEAFLSVPDAADRRALADTCVGIAGIMAVKRAMGR